MSNKVLWVIDSELDGMRFERLCVDLLFRNGFKDIIPIEPQDGGRDAEEFPRPGRGDAGEATFFQFSLEKNWKAKLSRDVLKLAKNPHKFSTLVFVTNQKARGVDSDKIATELLKKYGWKLIIFSREWLRLQLEEAHPDLAQKYLGIDVPAWSDHLSTVVQFSKPADKRLSDALTALERGAYDQAIVELQRLVKEKPESFLAWQALAWSQYCMYSYDDALASIIRALKLEKDTQGMAIRGCILAEKGIKERSKALILEALHLFEKVEKLMKTPNWQIFYNIGNVLSALGKYREAITHYEKALKLESREPAIWKNLATAYHLIGDHTAEMKCFDEAIELDPLKPETLASKGVSLLLDFEKPKEAISLLERALKHSPDFGVRWPNIWYWLGLAYLKCSSLKQALYWVEEGLSHQPGHLALKNLMSKVLVDFVPLAPEVRPKARDFWISQIEEQPLDYNARRQLARVEILEGKELIAWELLETSFDLMQIKPVIPLRNSGFKLDECIAALEFLPQYAHFRKLSPVSDYWKQDDPLYSLPFSPPSSDSIKPALTTYLAIPFGLGYKHLEENHLPIESKENLERFFEILRPSIEHAITETTRELTGLVPLKTLGAETVINKITEIIMFLGLIALREFARQRGWTITQFHISPNILNNALEGFDESLIERNVMVSSLIKLNEEIGFFPK